MRIIPVEPRGDGLRFGIAVSRYNELVTARLLEGAVGTLQAHGVRSEDIVVVWVPGAFELPMALQALARSGRFQALIGLGAVIRGETAHFEYVAGQAAAGMMRVALDHHLPIAFGVITAESLEQALARAGGPKGNRGSEAAQAALEMACLFRRLLEEIRDGREG